MGSIDDTGSVGTLDMGTNAVTAAQNGLKILHLIDSGGFYGAEKMLLGLVREQLRAGLRPTILSAGVPGEGPKTLEIAAEHALLPVVAWRMKPGLNLKEAWKILSWATSEQFDVLHSHGYKFNVLMGLWPRRLRRTPLVVTLHGYTRGRRFTKHWLYETVDRYSISRADRVVLVASAMKQTVSGPMIRSSRTQFIPNGLALDEIREAAEEPLEAMLAEFCDRHRPVLLGIGRLSHEKGFDRLIQAFPHLKARHPDAGLLIMGEGQLRPSLQALIQRTGQGQSALMPGYCECVPALMVRVDLVCMPSRTEGLPITLLEAMAIGTSICVTDVGEMASVLGDGKGGLVLKSAEPISMAEVISGYLHDEQLREDHVAWSRAQVEREYSAKAMASRYAALYAEVMSR